MLTSGSCVSGPGSAGPDRHVEQRVEQPWPRFAPVSTQIFMAWRSHDCTVSFACEAIFSVKQSSLMCCRGHRSTDFPSLANGSHREGYDENFGPSFSRAARPMLAKLEQDLEEAEAYLKLAHPPAARMDSSSRIKVRERLYAQASSVTPRPQAKAQPSRWEGAPSPYKDTGAYGKALWEKTSLKKGLQGRGGHSATARTLPDWAGKTLEEMEKRTS